VVGYIPRWFTCPQAVTHRSINQAWCTVTSLIGSDVLPLHHAYGLPYLLTYLQSRRWQLIVMAYK